MAVRTTPGAVEAVLTNDYDGESNLETFIEAAASIVDDASLAAVEFGTPLSTAKKELVERWVAAHLYKYAADRQFQQRSAGGVLVGGGFTGQTAMFLEGTTYGQTALTIETSGALRAVTMGQRARAFWLGKPYSEQTPYDQRD